MFPTLLSEKEVEEEEKGRAGGETDGEGDSLNFKPNFIKYQMLWRSNV